MYSNFILNLKSHIFPLLSTNATSIPFKYHKKICILLLGNLFQLISNLPIIYLPLFGHQWNPLPCSMSQNKALAYYLEINSNLFMNCLIFICLLLITNSTSTPVQYQKISCIVLLGKNYNLLLNWQSLILFLLSTNATPITFRYH